MEVTIRIERIEELILAANNLANALGVKNNTPAQNQQQSQQQAMPMQQAPVQQFAPAQPPMQQTNPIPTYQQPGPAPTHQQPMQQIPNQTSMPVQQNTPMQVPPTGQVPTSHTAQSFTQDQLAIAMTALCDAGKYDAVMGVLRQFGAETLMQVPKDQYAALATMLRGAGANI